MFEWLWDVVGQKGKPTGKAVDKPANNVIKVDSRTYPLVDINSKAFVAGDADINLMEGQKLKLTVVVEDRWGRFTFNASATLDKVGSNGGNFRGIWSVLPPEVEAVLGKYAQNKKAAARVAARPAAR